MVILIISEGWILKPNTFIHLVAPLPKTPINSTDRRSNNDKIKKIYANW